MSMKDKEDSSSAALITLSRNHNNNASVPARGSMDDAKYNPTPTPVIMDGDGPKASLAASGSNGGCSLGPAATAAAEATLDAFKLPTCPVGQRHRLFDQRRKACDYSCIFAVLGIVLMIIENEMTAGGVYTKVSPTRSGSLSSAFSRRISMYELHNEMRFRFRVLPTRMVSNL